MKREKCGTRSEDTWSTRWMKLLFFFLDPGAPFFFRTVNMLCSEVYYGYGGLWTEDVDGTHFANRGN